jgi:hypothetical protein
LNSAGGASETRKTHLCAPSACDWRDRGLWQQQQQHQLKRRRVVSGTDSDGDSDGCTDSDAHRIDGGDGRACG